MLSYILHTHLIETALTEILGNLSYTFSFEVVFLYRTLFRNAINGRYYFDVVFVVQSLEAFQMVWITQVNTIIPEDCVIAEFIHILESGVPQFALHRPYIVFNIVVFHSISLYRKISKWITTEHRNIHMNLKALLYIHKAK